MSWPLTQGATAAVITGAFAAVVPADSGVQTPLWMLLCLVMFLAGNHFGFRDGLRISESIKEAIVKLPQSAPTPVQSQDTSPPKAASATTRLPVVAELPEQETARRTVAASCPAFMQTLPKTVLTTVCASFKEIAIAPDDLTTEKFLGACQIFDSVLAAMGASMAIARKDFSNNMKKVKKVQERSSTKRVVELLEEEKDTGIHKPGGRIKDPSAAVGVLWIRRALSFNAAIYDALLESKGDSSSHALCAAGKQAYHKVLEPYHGWKLRSVFGLALKTLPSRDDFFTKVAGEVEDPEARRDVVYQQMSSLSASIKKLAVALEASQRELDLEDVSRV